MRIQNDDNKLSIQVNGRWKPVATIEDRTIVFKRDEKLSSAFPLNLLDEKFGDFVAIDYTGGRRVVLRLSEVLSHGIIKQSNILFLSEYWIKKLALTSNSQSENS